MPEWERAVLRVKGEQTGTGFVVDREQGLLLTCAHVVGDWQEVSVYLPDGTALPARVLENWAPDLDAALLQAQSPLPEDVPEPLLGLEVVPGHRFRSLGYHYAADPSPLPVEGEIRGPGRIGAQPAILLSGREVAEGMSGAPLTDLDTGLVVGIVRRYHERERWLACAVPLAAVAERWPPLRERTAEACYRRLLRAAYGFWERRFTPLEMTVQERERLPEARRGWIPPCFSALEEQEEPRDEEGQKRVIYRTVPLPGGLPEALDRYEAVVLLGDPGAGKTTALSHLAGKLADDPARIPVLVTLRRYERDEEILPLLRRTWALGLRDDLEAAISAGETEHLSLHGVEETLAPLTPLLEHLLEHGRLLLLLDGLNEMPGLQKDDPRLSRLAAFVDRARARGNRVVVSCRALDYADLRRPLERPLQPVILEPLDEERIRTFLRNYLGEERGEALARWLQEPEQRAIRDLCAVPFFLRLVAYLYEREGKPPSRRIDLLDRYIQVAVKREQERRGEKWPPAALVEVLADLALAMQEAGRLEFRETEAIPYLASFPCGGAAAALRVAEGAGLLRATPTSDLQGAWLRFAHQLWQQDLAARALVRQAKGDPQNLWEALRPHLLEERYAEVFPLAAARLEDADLFIRRLLEANRNDFWQQRPLFRAAAALAEGTRVSEETQQAILSGLVFLIKTRRWFEPGRADAGRALRTLVRLNAIDVLRTIAQNPNFGADIRQASAEALGELGRVNEAVEILLTLARSEQTNADIRQEAARALSKLGRTKEATEICLALARDEQIDADVRWKAAEALVQLGQVEEAVQILLSLAQDKRIEDWVRRDAARTLGHWGQTNQATKSWLTLAQDDWVDGRVRSEAAKALEQLGQADKAAEAWLTIAQDMRVETWIRQRAAEALGKLGRTEEAAEILLALARNKQVDFDERAEAVWALDELSRAEDLLSLSRDEQMEASIRLIAAEALSRHGQPEEAAEVLLDLTGNKWADAQIRLPMAPGEWIELSIPIAAAEVLAGLGRTEQALEILQSIAQDKQIDARLRQEAAEALGRLGLVERASDVLMSLAKDGQVETEVRLRAAKALVELGKPGAAAEALRTLTQEREARPWARTVAAESLIRSVWPEEIVEILRTLAQDEQVEVTIRQGIVATLDRLSQVSEVMEKILALAQDEQREVQILQAISGAQGLMSQADEAARVFQILVQDKQLEADVRQWIGEALTLLSQPDETAEILRALAKDKRIKTELLRVMVLSLGQLGRAGDLLELARDESVDPDIRAVAEEELRKWDTRWNERMTK